MSELRRKQVQDYLGRLESAGLGEHREKLWPTMAAYLQEAPVTA